MAVELKTLARPYAVAAYQFAKQHQQIEAWTIMLANLRQIVLSEAVQTLLNMPQIESARLLTILQAVVAKTLDANGVNFLKLLLANHRLNLAPIIFELFEAIKTEAENVISVDVTTAIALNDKQQSVVLDNIVKQLQRKALSSFHVDESIIGGAVIRIGEDYVVDGSLHTQLKRLKTQFYAASH